ncbi:hypothetical protein CEXT_489081 [Caerostris extrusa]|uniref:Uncharacterized protein n=1 Tax=Caerostris extrusa TaxID=172846 RepID=A0AAV4YCQ6_CAEEX|nr:hypothetical protein CEXT_489081 [Caerostris extrusa]
MRRICSAGGSLHLPLVWKKLIGANRRHYSLSVRDFEMRTTTAWNIISAYSHRGSIVLQQISKNQEGHAKILAPPLPLLTLLRTPRSYASSGSFIDFRTLSRLISSSTTHP